jgi:hypothetical protein
MASKDEVEALNEAAVAAGIDARVAEDGVEAVVAGLRDAALRKPPPASEMTMGSKPSQEALTVRQAMNQCIDTIANAMQRERKAPGTLVGIQNELRQGLNDMEGHPLLDK